MGPLVALGRAAAGALLFGLPMLMTMEMWQLGSHVKPHRLALLLVLSLPLLTGLSHYAGFEETLRLRDDLADALAAIVVATVVSAAGLALLGVLGPGTSPSEVVGMIALQAVPASIGALLARSQLGKSLDEQERRAETWGGEIFISAAGALFLAFNMAPTEEVMLIAYRMGPGLAVALLLASLLVMHAFVYAVQFKGQAEIPPGSSTAALFARYTVVAYVVAAGISAYILWTFGRFDGVSLAVALTATLVLAFPAAVGAAAARLIL